MKPQRDGAVARSHISTDDIETTPTLTDLLEVYDATDQNERKAISILTLMTNLLVRFAVQAMTANGAIDLNAVSLVTLSKSGVLAATIAAPIAGQLLIITQVDAGTDGHTVTLAAGTWDGTNDIATFNAKGETLFVVGLSATLFLIITNVGAVALSSS